MQTKDSSAVLDISAPLAPGMPAWPGDPPFRRDALATLDAGPFALSRISMSAHAGSHLDFPAHVVPGGRCAADYPPGRFLLAAAVVALPPGAAEVTHADAIRAGIAPGEAILFKTAGPARPGGPAPALTPEAARACVGAEAGLVGIDAPSVDPADDAGLPAHRILLGNDILVLEGIDLSAVPPGRYTLSCLPLRLEGCEASPVRAVLLPLPEGPCAP